MYHGFILKFSSSIAVDFLPGDFSRNYIKFKKILIPSKTFAVTCQVIIYTFFQNPSRDFFGKFPRSIPKTHSLIGKILLEFSEKMNTIAFEIPPGIPADILLGILPEVAKYTQNILHSLLWKFQ